jgi:transcriptional antiterminator RfaH
MTMQLAHRAGGAGILPANRGALGLGFGERWFAVNTQPLAGARAGRNLENQGFRAFMPRHRGRVRHARKLIPVLAPLFPRCLFVAFDSRRDPSRPLRTTTERRNLMPDG